MEKGTPHCKLAVVKALIEAGKVRMTASAIAGGERMGFDWVDGRRSSDPNARRLLQEHDDPVGSHDLAGCLPA